MISDKDVRAGFRGLLVGDRIRVASADGGPPVVIEITATYTLPGSHALTPDTSTAEFNRGSDVPEMTAIPTADDCDESEPDQRDQEIARLRSIVEGWAARWSDLVAERAALMLEIAKLRTALAAATPKPPKPEPNPLHRAIAVRGDGVMR